MYRIFEIEAQIHDGSTWTRGLAITGRVKKIRNETKTEKWATTHSGTRTHDLLIAGQVLYH